jgi:hypothetical protein
MFLIYSAFAGAWLWISYKVLSLHVLLLLPFKFEQESTRSSPDSSTSLCVSCIFDVSHNMSWQYYLSSLVGLLVIEMVANWGTFSILLLLLTDQLLPLSLLQIPQRTRENCCVNSVPFRG